MREKVKDDKVTLLDNNCDVSCQTLWKSQPLHHKQGGRSGIWTYTQFPSQIDQNKFNNLGRSFNEYPCKIIFQIGPVLLEKNIYKFLTIHIEQWDPSPGGHAFQRIGTTWKNMVQGHPRIICAKLFSNFARAF